VRARMVEHPGEYRWSSYRYNILGLADRLITAHSLYLELGDTAQVRADRYKEFFKIDIDPDILHAIRVTQTRTRYWVMTGSGKKSVEYCSGG